MTDKAVFIGMTGAKSSMRELEIITNNLANANTTGFRADYEVTKQHPISDSKTETRVYSSVGRNYTDFTPGPAINTGRDLDVSMENVGFITVQSKAGKEGYTRAGNLELINGNLVTHSGDLVMGNGGVINIPPAQKINIAPDGSVSAQLMGTGPDQMVTIDRIKLANPNTADLQKGEDGLFYMKNNGTAPADEKIRIVHGALEGSNVNTVETLTKLIELSRHFEVHTNLMKSMQENSTKANEILSLHE